MYRQFGDSFVGVEFPLIVAYGSPSYRCGVPSGHASTYRHPVYSPTSVEERYFPVNVSVFLHFDTTLVNPWNNGVAKKVPQRAFSMDRLMLGEALVWRTYSPDLTCSEFIVVVELTDARPNLKNCIHDNQLIIHFERVVCLVDLFHQNLVNRKHTFQLPGFSSRFFPFPMVFPNPNTGTRFSVLSPR